VSQPLSAVQEALRESEARYRTLFDSIDEGFCIIEVMFDDSGKAVDYRFLEINPAFEKQTGLVNARGKTMRELAPKHEEHWFEIYGKIALTGEGIRFRNRAEQLNRTYDVYAFRFGDPKNRQVAILFNDISERHRAEEELGRFFSLSLDFLCIASADGFFKRVSPAVTDMLGWTVEEFLARPYIDLVHPDDRERTLQEVERQITSGEKVLQFENRYLHKDGSWRTLSWRSVPQGQLMYATARDVTDLRRQEDRIRVLNMDLQLRAVQLEEANRELESFSYSVSHDLRAPLRHVVGYAEMFSREVQGKVSEKGERYLATISESARKMGQLIDDLLAFSRMGRAEMHETAVDLNAMVSMARQDLELAVRDRNIVWNCANLPKAVGDPAMLRLVFANLMGNAVKYSRGRNPAEIEVACNGMKHDRLVFYVRDNGAGFESKYADKLFNVFQRLHGEAEFEGTGIGLANVRRIISRHGGLTWATGQTDKGATFYFTLKPAA
jgi:PAS domain S-box-containing protein